MHTPPSPSDPLRVAVIAGSTRPGRRSAAVATWVVDHATRRPDLEVELVDLADHALPMLDEAIPAIAGMYEHPHTQRWSDTIASFDAFVFVTPEYNHSVPGALKNAIDFLYAEWVDKAAGFVSYGADAAGTRAVEHLRLITAEVHLAGVRDQVALAVRDDFTAEDSYATCTPRTFHAARMDAMLDDVTAWGGALRALRRGVAEGRRAS